MKKDFYLTRYALIIKKLERMPSTYHQIEEYLLNTFEFQDANVKSYSIRTLQRDIIEINRLFNLKIHNKKKSDNRYYIESRPVMEIDEYNQKLLESFQMGNIMNMHPDFSDFIFFETRKPTGLGNFYDLYFAIRNKRIIHFDYYHFDNQFTTKRKVHPLSLKESKNRWYLSAVDTKDKRLKSFGLDRIHFLEVSKGKFRNKYQYQLKEHFKNSFGVISLADEDPQKVVIKCTKQQGEYIKSFPLHLSQKTIFEDKETMIFELYVYVTYDLMQEFLSFGKEVVVLEPSSLVEDIQKMLYQSMENYNQK